MKTLFIFLFPFFLTGIAKHDCNNLFVDMNNLDATTTFNATNDGDVIKADYLYIQNNIKISIHVEKEEIIQGKSIPIYLILENTGNLTATIPLDFVDFSFIHHEKGITFKDAFVGKIIVPANRKKYFSFSLPQAANYTKEKLLIGTGRLYWPIGHYAIHCIIKKGNIDLSSNTVEVKINSVPENFIEAFTDLKRVWGYSKDPWPNRELMYEKHKNTIYKQEFLEKLLKTFDYQDAIKGLKGKEFQEQVMDLYLEYILSFPNTLTAQSFFMNIYINREHHGTIVNDLYSKIKEIDTTDLVLKKNLLLVYIRQIIANGGFKELKNQK